MDKAGLERVARAMVVKDKGILAADESSGTIKKRFEAIQLESTEEHRRSYRELLFTTPGIGQWISGVIFYDETLRQKTRDGMPFAAWLEKQGVLPGIKVDLGAKPLAGFPGETITEGLDGLRERLVEYYKLGARFAKWRAVIDIAEGVPSRFGIEANAHALARYAALCQEQQIVPIVEPEVLMDGAHSIERCEAVTNAVLAEVFHQLGLHRIHLEGMVLKPNMVISGKKAANRASPEQVAEATLRTLRRHVPSAVPGIAFLSGGQSSPEATLHLSLMNKPGPLPWNLTFSYGRALQDAAIKAWGGKQTNVAAGQKELAKRARLNSLATTGRYAVAQEADAA
ncbi:MAG TPA: fructose-bisphosphate aldolase class I [Steroidobacteraceae bacterium]|mgnify:FL=1|nr:fructose-bisphosphate aldolase class I [Steroidobacteraceae bacterium]HQW09855.1 fructose-bisphosphate aldolase class I [Steroidobacteraceae bacterium]HQX47568.1 fructose-bisphosphate aldolase class I [Steroidobacteraceae bacterium]HQX79656.1 fructose-bisphosphate aldolase class I [Steroidobacteraceae bacterium]HQZ81276.1 fructose-bisphosphate aldolase class I [Steroidobacteraceae bacterium]